MRYIALLFGLAMVASAFPGEASIPSRMSYQGVLTDAGSPVDATENFLFRIYDVAVGGDPIWEETQPGVVVEAGVFNVILGVVTPIDLPFDRPYWLGVTVPAGSGEELIPRTALVSSPYSFRAGKADTALVTLSGGGSADTLWQTDGVNVFRQAGTVGIGIDPGSQTNRLRVDASTNWAAWVTNSGLSDVRLAHEGGAGIFVRSDAPGNPYLLHLSAGDTSLFIVKQDGNVGIGTSDPTERLTVEGEIGVSGIDVGTNKKRGFLLQGSSVGTWIDPDNPNSKAAILNGDDAIYFTTDGGDNNHFTVQSNKAGIGLGVDGSLKPIMPTITLALGDNATGLNRVGVNAIGLLSGGNETARFTTAGNVGIGTTNPSERLDVSGTVRATGFKLPTGAASGRVLTSDASGNGTWQPSAGGIGGAGTANYISKFTGASTVGNASIYETSGNIGIGTTSPGAKLEVKGSLRVDDRIRFTRNGYWVDLDLYTSHPTADPRLYIYVTPGGGTRTQVGMLSGGSLQLFGDLTATGTKCRAVEGTEYGTLYYNAVESGSAIFTTSGRGKLNDGRARVDLDPKWLAGVTIDENHPLDVTSVVFYGEHGNWYAKPETDRFEIVEASGASVEFFWTVQASQRGYEDLYLSRSEASAADYGERR